ncbi:MAG: TIGR03364 family FAD-dependent oxidoreductase [Anaerolineae bacterium]|nr:TIGR03364 family FAD-dependent oxidoreductase [Anaerolineae bacterium]
MTNPKVDVAIVGAGIVGLAHALAAARRGLKVALFERTSPAVGASIRNFGQVWPVGKTGSAFQLAMKSREIWLDLSQRADFYCLENGSLHLAYHDDELAVLEEFIQSIPEARTYCQILTPEQVLEKSPAVKPQGLKGALWSITELNLDPRQAIRTIPGWLHQEYGVELHFSTLVTGISMPYIETTAGRWQADQVFVCSGADFETLYPQEYAQTGIMRCKLQMLRTVPQPGNWKLGPNLCAGLTMVHYGYFAHCPSFEALSQRMDAELPFYRQHHIHLLLSQTALGELTIGDHHEYGQTFDPFDREDINQAMLDYLLTFAQAPTFAIAERWHGIYAMVKGQTEVILHPESHVTIVNGLGGSGMTRSFGLAEQVFSQL